MKLIAASVELNNRDTVLQTIFSRLSIRWKSCSYSPYYSNFEVLRSCGLKFLVRYSKFCRACEWRMNPSLTLAECFQHFVRRHRRLDPLSYGVGYCANGKIRSGHAVTDA